MRWWAADPGRWERELSEMRVWFPEWKSYESVREREILTRQGFVKEPVLVLVWEGALQPLPDGQDEAVKILADLAENRTVLVDRGGMLRHPPDCAGAHVVPQPIRERQEYGVAFWLRAEHSLPPAHPEVCALRPFLGPELYYTQGHVNQDGTLCPYTSSDDDWNGQSDTLAKYLRHGVSIFLAKHLHWEWTGKGIWPGHRGPHGTREAITESMRRPPTVQCRCGSGRPYSECHRDADRELPLRSAR